jgi:hypothetical protein
LDSLNTKVNSHDVDKYLTFFHNNSFEYDWLDFATKYLEYFYLSGNLVDVEIPINKMQTFINENYPIIERLAQEHINKIKDYKATNKLIH